MDLKAEIERAFARLIADDLVELGEDGNELHIIGDEWTLVLDGTTAMLAVDDDEGDPETVLEAIDDDELAALRDLDAALEGALDSALVASPDPLTKALARILEG